MIYYPLTAVSRSTESALDPATTLTDEGQFMVNTLVNGVGYAKPSAGIAGEVFLGVSFTQTSASNFIPTTSVKVEKILIPVSGLVTVGATPLAGTTFAYDDANGAVITVVSVTGTTVDLGAVNAGKTARVQFRYTLTSAQAQAVAGSGTPGGYSGQLYGRVGLAQTGLVYTDRFDTSKDFAAATAIKLDANGRITDQTGATGVAIHAVVRSLPTVNYPFLGVEFNAV
jgi:hypothetical protein